MARRHQPGPYLALDINFAGHPKILALSDGAFRLHLAGLLYCKRQRTDGIIAGVVVSTLVPRYRPRQLDELTARLLWVELNGAGHYEIHDWLDWNLSLAEGEAIAEKRREAARKRWDN